MCAARREPPSQSAERAASTPSGDPIRPLILGAMPLAAGALSTAQLDAVSHAGGPLLILGGAGTGKTRTLEERFAWLVAEGTAPDAILALTHSRGAAASLRAAFESRMDAAWEELWVSPFGELCARLLREEAIEAGVHPPFAPGAPPARPAPPAEPGAPRTPPPPPVPG